MTSRHFSVQLANNAPSRTASRLNSRKTIWNLVHQSGNLSISGAANLAMKQGRLIRRAPRFRAHGLPPGTCLAVRNPVRRHEGRHGRAAWGSMRSGLMVPSPAVIGIRAAPSGRVLEFCRHSCRAGRGYQSPEPDASVRRRPGDGPSRTMAFMAGRIAGACRQTRPPGPAVAVAGFADSNKMARAPGI